MSAQLASGNNAYVVTGLFSHAMLMCCLGLRKSLSFILFNNSYLSKDIWRYEGHHALSYGHTKSDKTQVKCAVTC